MSDTPVGDFTGYEPPIVCNLQACRSNRAEIERLRGELQAVAKATIVVIPTGATEGVEISPTAIGGNDE